MSKLGLILCLLLCMPLVVRSQTSIPSCTQSFVLEGRALSNDEPVADAAIVVVNKSTRLEKTTMTDSSGRFMIGDLSCGSYDISIKKSGFTEINRTVELQTTIPLVFKLEDAGIDPPPTTGGGSGGDVPVGGESSSAGGGGGSGGGRPRPPTTEARSRNPETNSSVNGPVTEAFSQAFTGDIDCRTWLESQKAKRKRLARIIPVTDGKSIFMLETVKQGVTFNYTVLPISESPDENGLLNRIRLNSDKTFVGVHRLGPTSYLMVFYGR